MPTPDVRSSHMAKLGKPYENVVALIGEALHPGASVEVGEWIDGPDGEREVDVSIKGVIDGQGTFIFLECKDWKKDVGIESIDALDSKRQDLAADRTIIVSNSGFTSGALRKANRKSIMCMSALAQGNDTIRFVLNREFQAKRLSVTGGSWQLAGTELPTELNLNDLQYDGLNFTAWIRDRSIKLLRENEFASTITYAASFREPLELLGANSPVLITGITLILSCKRVWVAQIIREDVSRGMYDHLKQHLLIPDQETWSLEFDGRKWREIEPEIEPNYLNVEPGTIQLHMTLFEPLYGNAVGPAPLLDALVKEEKAIV